MNFKRNEEFELFFQEIYDFQNLENETLFIDNYENVKKYALNWLAAKLWLKRKHCFVECLHF